MTTFSSPSRDAGFRNRVEVLGSRFRGEARPMHADFTRRAFLFGGLAALSTGTIGFLFGQSTATAHAYVPAVDPQPESPMLQWALDFVRQEPTLDELLDQRAPILQQLLIHELDDPAMWTAAERIGFEVVSGWSMLDVDQRQRTAKQLLRLAQKRTPRNPARWRPLVRRLRRIAR